jgi:hypothetical protein
MTDSSSKTHSLFLDTAAVVVNRLSGAPTKEAAECSVYSTVCMLCTACTLMVYTMTGRDDPVAQLPVLLPARRGVRVAAGCARAGQPAPPFPDTSPPPHRPHRDQVRRDSWTVAKMIGLLSSTSLGGLQSYFCFYTSDIRFEDIQN